jgi:hypothetical protein
MVVIAATWQPYAHSNSPANCQRRNWTIASPHATAHHLVTAIRLALLADHGHDSPHALTAE